MNPTPVVRGSGQTKKPLDYSGREGGGMTMIDRVDERCQVELNRLSHFRELGLQPHLAVQAVDDGIDWHDLKGLLEQGCRLEIAMEILR